MIRRYRDLDVPGEIEGRRDLIRENDGRLVVIRHSDSNYFLSGILHHASGSLRSFFLVDQETPEQRLRFSYIGLRGIGVEAFPDRRIGSADPKTANAEIEVKPMPSPARAYN